MSRYSFLFAWALVPYVVSCGAAEHEDHEHEEHEHRHATRGSHEKSNGARSDHEKPEPRHDDPHHPRRHGGGGSEG